MVGIAGGLKDEVGLGDVMVARSVADYTVGKVREDGTREERWEMIPADAALLNAANAFRSGWEALVSEPRPEAEGKPVRHAGLVASGGDVIASKKHIATYQQDMPKLIGVEMEGGGVAAALHNHRLRPRLLMIRGVSDLADGEGNGRRVARCSGPTPRRASASARSRGCLRGSSGAGRDRRSAAPASPGATVPPRAARSPIDGGPSPGARAPTRAG